MYYKKIMENDIQSAFQNLIAKTQAEVDTAELKSLVSLGEIYKRLEKVAPEQYKKLVELMTLVAETPDDGKLKVPWRLRKLARSYGYHKYPIKDIKTEANRMFLALSLSPETIKNISQIDSSYIRTNNTFH